MRESAGFALAQACRAHRTALDAALRSLGLHVGQEMILMQLWAEEGLAQSQLAERLCVEPPTVTKMLQRMEQDALIRREPDAFDARVLRVFLGVRGRALQSEIERCWMAVDAQAIAGLTTEERLLLRRLLQQIRENLA
ncbi:MAG TPA: MarR family transcriptional regulator [Roseiflexaceae bacterium]|nr:MarR family transcriptional regulator [Roseiflexaceae bacterium]